MASTTSTAPVASVRTDGSARSAALRGRLGRVGRAARSVAAIGGFLALWEVLPRVGAVDSTFLPPFSEVVAAWMELAGNGQLLNHTAASVRRAALGFAIALFAAIPLGLALGWYRPVADFLNPLLELFRNTAALALLPAFVLILGIGETAKVALIIYSCTWPILLSTVSGVRNVEPLLVKSARSMGLSSAQLFQKVILPAAVPVIFTGVRLAAAYSIVVLVAAEMVGAKAGLGYLINAAQFNFEAPAMYAGIVTISVLGLVLNQALLAVERRALRWRPAAND